jgi:ribosomal protein S27E
MPRRAFCAAYFVAAAGRIFWFCGERTMYPEKESRNRQNRHKGKSTRADCPSCGNGVPIYGQASVGQRAVCPSCKTQLEIVWLEPIELDFPYEYDDDDYDQAYEEGQ